MISEFICERYHFIQYGCYNGVEIHDDEDGEDDDNDDDESDDYDDDNDANRMTIMIMIRPLLYIHITIYSLTCFVVPDLAS